MQRNWWHFGKKAFTEFVVSNPFGSLSIRCRIMQRIKEERGGGEGKDEEEGRGRNEQKWMDDSNWFV
jgi:hypothetical protein